MQTALAQDTMGLINQPTDESPHRADMAGVLQRDSRSARIIAKSLYRELRDGGSKEQDVIAVATELLGLVADEMRAGR